MRRPFIAETGYCSAKAKLVEDDRLLIELIIIALVDYQHDALGGAAKHLGDVPIDRSYPIDDADNEDDGVRLLDGDLDLLADGSLERIARLGTKPPVSTTDSLPAQSASP